MRVRIFPPRLEPITEPWPEKEDKEHLVRRYERESDSDRLAIAHGVGHAAVPDLHYIILPPTSS
jgi:hypothetical protein